MATIAQLEEQIVRTWQTHFGYELSQTLETHLRQGALVGIQTALQSALIEELNAHLGFDPYTRIHTGKKEEAQRRSGYFHRCVTTSLGAIDRVRVPKLRAGNKNRTWNILVRYRQATQALLDKALYMYLLGLSIRDLQEALYLFTGDILSRGAINRITTDVQQTMLDWQHQPIEEPPPILIVDGVWVKVLYPTEATYTDKSGHLRKETRAQERVLTVAMAVHDDGSYYILGTSIATEENTGAWEALFDHLICRGLDKQAVTMVVSDGSKGALQAMKNRLPNAAMQRCTIHKVRGFARYLTYQDLPELSPSTSQPISPEQARQHRRQQMKADASAIFNAPTKVLAEERLDDFVKTWDPIEPKAVHNFTWGIKRCFTFYQHDIALHRRIRSSNLLERFFREFRGKADEIGAFPNEKSCLSLFYLVMVREHAKHDRVNLAKT